jgi:hypothetical protein
MSGRSGFTLPANDLVKDSKRKQVSLVIHTPSSKFRGRGLSNVIVVF